MKYMVNWMEYDKGLKRDVQWNTYFEKQSEAIEFMNDRLNKGFTGIELKVLK